jgi:plasmid stabilization system protein ParE
MTFEVRLRPEAEDDLFEAAVWYEAQQPGLGQRFLEAVTAAISKISTSPLAYTIVYRSIRRALLQRFPFGVFYRVEEGQILVIAVLHGSRHPRRWRQRV